MKKLFMVLTLLILCSAGQVWASGLAIPEQGAAAMALSAAVTARSENLSAIFYNPAAIDYIENNEVFIGVTPITPSHTLKGEGFSTDSKSALFIPPQLYGARRFHDRLIAGIGVFAPFGLGTEWDNEWNGRYTSTFAEIQCIYINPTVAYQVNDMISLGVGISYVTSNAKIERMFDTGLALYGASGNNAAIAPMIANPAYDSQFALDGDGSGFGFNLGALIRPIEKLQIGISYRGATDIDYEGKATFAHKNALKAIDLGPGVTAYDAIIAQMPASQDGEATLHLPWMLNLGAAYDITDVWDASVDCDFVGWSVYDELTIEFSDGIGPGLALKEKTDNKDWENTFVFRLGTSYDVNESFIARGGFLFDQTPIPDTTIDGQLPGNDRIGISFGAGYKIGMINVDASYMFLKFSDREKNNLVGYTDLDTPQNGVDKGDQATLNGALALQGRGAYPVGNGDFESNAHLFSISASYKF